MTTRDQIALGATGLALALAALGGWLWLAPTLGGEPPLAASEDPFGDPFATPFMSGAAPSERLVVDVEGGVNRPGIVELAAGARVADAIAAAGGYSSEADLLAAMQSINLAAPLSDGQQVFVPIRGVAGGGSGGGGESGLVDLNRASPEALDALPGIGPVTVQKIVAARAERPFATLEELVERDVMTNAQLDGIRDLVTLS